MSASSSRDPQMSFRLGGAEPEPASRWRDGEALAFLGGSLRLVLDTRHLDALRVDDTLHLPLPPEATPRQIQDRAEAWLRQEAKRCLQEIIAQKFLEGRSALTLAGRRVPRLALSFAARGHWVEVENGDTLRCNWRLIEQARPVIEQAIGRAIAALPRDVDGVDLFGLGHSSSLGLH